MYYAYRERSGIILSPLTRAEQLLGYRGITAKQKEERLKQLIIAGWGADSSISSNREVTTTTKIKINN